MDNRPAWNRRLLLIVFVLCVTQVISICVIAVLWMRPNQKPESLVVINSSDPFIAQRATEFDLPQVIPQYDQVISAIESFHQNNGYYPRDLKTLTPDYLSKVPGIYIRNGETLIYTLESTDMMPSIMSNQENGTPFTFLIYGHYPGFASMHGWYLYYCPEVYESCNNPGDRHQSSFRINDRWIWINSSAL